MKHFKVSTTTLILLSTASLLTACGQSGTSNSGTSAKASAAIKYDIKVPAAFSASANCATPDVIVSAYPNRYIMDGLQACEIGSASMQDPTWTYKAGGVCITNGQITKTDASFTKTLTHTDGINYALTSDDGSPAQTLTLCDANVQNAPALWAAEIEPNDKTDFDFEQSYYKYCEGAGCTGFPKHFQKYSDYSDSVLAPLNLTTDLQRRLVKNHLESIYGGKVIQSSFNNKNHATDNLLTFQLLPDGNPALDEYVLYVRTESDSGFSKVKDWGGRVKCAPARTDTPYQATPCP